MQTYTVALTASWVQFGVWVMAFWFTSNGPAAYLTCPTMIFDPMTSCTTQLLGFVPVTVNLCHALCHFITGLIGLVAVLRRNWAAAYAIGAGLFYLTWGLLGVFGGVEVRHHLGVDIFGSWVHIVEGVILFLIWASLRLTTKTTPQTISAAP